MRTGALIMANRPAEQVDLSSYLLASIIAAVLLLALAGPTSAPIWIFIALWWGALAIVDRVNKSNS
jgi:hypothetical protein